MAPAALVSRCRRRRLLLLLAALALALYPATISQAELYEDSIATVLEANGLPIGLLPASVQSFSVSEDGGFEVHLAHSCYAKFDYEVHYAQIIAGKVSYGNVTGLSGIQAKEARFLWVPVTGIQIRDPTSGYIYFDVGPVTTRLPLAQFEVVPDCKTKSGISTFDGASLA